MNRTKKIRKSRKTTLPTMVSHEEQGAKWGWVADGCSRSRSIIEVVEAFERNAKFRKWSVRALERKVRFSIRVTCFVHKQLSSLSLLEFNPVFCWTSNESEILQSYLLSLLISSPRLRPDFLFREVKLVAHANLAPVLASFGRSLDDWIGRRGRENSAQLESTLSL